MKKICDYCGNPLEKPRQAVKRKVKCLRCQAIDAAKRKKKYYEQQKKLRVRILVPRIIKNTTAFKEYLLKSRKFAKAKGKESTFEKVSKLYLQGHKRKEISQRLKLKPESVANHILIIKRYL